MVIDFVLKPGTYDQIPDLLVRMVPEFERSAEFHDVAADRDLPGVVCSALARYLVSLEKRAMQTSGLDSQAAEILSSIYQAIEELAGCDDPFVQNAVVVDIFEVLDCDQPVLEVIVSKLLPKSSALYERWLS